MEQPVHSARANRDAAIAFLEGFREGRPLRELVTALPNELEATGQREAARILRSFFREPGTRVERGALAFERAA
jgi:hypothetical protein